MKIELSIEDLKELRTCLEILQAVEVLEFHNKNFLASWTNDPCILSQEKQALLKRALIVVGTSATQSQS